MGADGDVASQRVLIADDTQTIRGVVKACLSTMGFRQFYEVANGRDALNILRSRNVDLVICDWEMPEMDGLELLQELRGTESIGRIPFIMLTGSADAELVRRCIELDIDGYVVKPFQPRVLCDKVAAVARKTASNEFSLD